MQIRSSIKAKLTVATLLPLTTAIVICWLAGVFILNNKIAAQAQDKVRNDLNTAREVYNHELSHIRDAVRFTAASTHASEALTTGDREKLSALLTPLLNGEQFDILDAVDATGKVLYRAQNPAVSGDDRSDDRFVMRALKGETIDGTTILPAAELMAESPELARRAAIRLVATPNASPRNDREEERGLVLLAAAPVRDKGGTVIGALRGGVLLNNNNMLVDKIKNLVYEGVKFEGVNVGNATIFLGDLRIATNVVTASGTRAIGTRMAADVFNRVILRGEKWRDRAFVVNSWYFTAYEPILSLEGVPIGALYVGMQEVPYTATKVSMGILYSGVLLLGCLIGLGISWLLGSKLAQPIKALENAVRRVGAGERNLKIRVTDQDEIGSLAAEFNRMTATLEQREEAIRELNRGLEEKVQERTAELEEKNRLLVQTREELVRAEKLAAVGELAAGVAHEINNPLAIIRGNVELLQMSIPEEADNREEADTIYQQVNRMERIVANLLSFARQQRKELGQTDLNRMLGEIVRQVGHQVPLTGIRVEERYAPDLPLLAGDEGQLRQVFTNLILNAVQAMPDGGTLSLATASDPAAGSCAVTVTDTGIGVPEEQQKEIFNPFFTTKPDGTGLGLSVSYGIVREHSGTIRMESAPGRGSAFTVTLPLRQQPA